MALRLSVDKVVQPEVLGSGRSRMGMDNPMPRFADNLEGLCTTTVAPARPPLDLVQLGGRTGLGVALGAAAALVGLLAWLFA